MFSIILLAVAFSKSRSSINWKLVGTGLAIQIILALFILKGSVLEQYWSLLGWPKIFFSWLFILRNRIGFNDCYYCWYVVLNRSG